MICVAGALYKADDEVNRKIKLYGGDITHLQIDAIVNAAKSSLAGVSFTYIGLLCEEWK